MVESQPGGSEYRARVIEAIYKLRSEIRWKPGKDIRHLQTRKSYGHLSPTATLPQYEAIIQQILFDEAASVYVYIWQQADLYPTIVSLYENQSWLVMFGLNGIMETSFPPTDPDEYLSDPRFQYIGLMGELLNEE